MNRVRGNGRVAGEGGEGGGGIPGRSPPPPCRTIVQYHQSTLRLQLHIFQLAKLISHSVAMYSPGTVQLAQQLVLTRASVGRPLWDSASWAECCAADQAKSFMLPAFILLVVYIVRNIRAVWFDRTMYLLVWVWQMRWFWVCVSKRN